jgi:fructose-bisphosphate aldolase, class I
MKFDTDCPISYNSYKECKQQEQEMVAFKNSILNSKTGKSVVVAFDHGIGGKIYSPNPRTLAEKFIAAQPDGVLMSPPLIHLCADLFVKYPKVVPIATLVTLVRKPKFAGPTQVFDFDFAIEMGARAIKNILVIGQTDGAGMLENMKNTAYLAQRARQKGIPFMVEAVAWGEQIPPDKEASPEYIGQACRMALECGADVIKTTYTGDLKSFKEVLANVPIPVIILGGAAGELPTVFQGVRDAMDAGAAGVAFGRNVFQSENPSLMVNALKELVHNGATVQEAIAKMK